MLFALLLSWIPFIVQTFRHFCKAVTNKGACFGTVNPQPFFIWRLSRCLPFCFFLIQGVYYCNLETGRVDSPPKGTNNIFKMFFLANIDVFPLTRDSGHYPGERETRPKTWRLQVYPRGLAAMMLSTLPDNPGDSRFYSRSLGFKISVPNLRDVKLEVLFCCKMADILTI